MHNKNIFNMKKIRLTLSRLLVIFGFSIFLLLLSNETKAQVPTSYENGHFYRDNSNGRVYWFAYGKLRHVQSSGTLNGLFTGATRPENMFYSNALGPNAPYGQPLTPNNGLINDTSTGKVYFRRENYIYYINSEALFNQMHFSWAAITNVSNISGYIECQSYLPPAIPPIGQTGCIWE